MVAGPCKVECEQHGTVKKKSVVVRSIPFSYIEFLSLEPIYPRKHFDCSGGLAAFRLFLYNFVFAAFDPT